MSNFTMLQIFRSQKEVDKCMKILLFHICQIKKNSALIFFVKLLFFPGVSDCYTKCGALCCGSAQVPSFE